MTYTRTTSASPQASGTGRTVKYKFSDNSVARDNHTIASGGWQLANFQKNPVFLWAHDLSALPIGKVIDITATSTALVGTVEYAAPDQYPFADTVYQLVKGGFLNATSVSWNPIEWSYTSDRSRPGGIDFKTQELLEVSQVPVPALPGALAEARARGINTAPIYQWAERLLDKRGKVLVPRAQLEALRREAKMPTSSRHLRTPFTSVADGIAERKQRALDAKRRVLRLTANLSTREGREDYVRKLRATFGPK